MGGTFRELLPEQKAQLERWVAEYKTVFKRQIDAQQFYDQLPMSARTTFQAVTHALLNTKLTSENGKPMGTALDLVDVVERVSGQVPDTRGDRQFRVYVYLKPGALNTLHAAREFQRGHDNAVYHIGYPINFRQDGGVPSIQISVARTGRRADIDVDYRSSAGVKALVSGHLTSANSDVRAGNNELTHNKRWSGLANWWKEMLALFVEKPAPEESTEGFAPGAEQERKRIARGPIDEAINAYLTDWLVKGKPQDLMPLISIKAYPCVAELGGDSRPDSKLALARLLRQLKERNEMLGQVKQLEDVVQPIAYRLPDATPVKHSFEKIFSLQEVHEDVAWAIDCRIRYNLQMVESIPRPPHRLNKTYVASMRIKNPKEPGSFQVHTWQQEAGEWRLVSMDIKRKTLTPPPDLLSASAAQPAPGSDAAQLAVQAEKLFDTWLVQKRSGEAARFFLPESFACDALTDIHSPAKAAATPDSKNLVRFLDEAAKNALTAKQLEGVIAAAEAAHHEMKPISHPKSGAFLLAEVSGESAGDEFLRVQWKSPAEPQ